MKRILLLILLGACFASSIANNKLDIYVSPKGEDTNKGTVSSPVKTINGAREAIKNAFAEMQYAEVNVLFAEGDYKIS